MGELQQERGAGKFCSVSFFGIQAAMPGFHFSLQIELDKAAEDFRRVHHERQELIKQWENTIEQMRKRDQEIDHCGLVICFLGCGFLTVHVAF